MAMKTEFIPHEQALELRNLGFNELCFAQYEKYDVGEAILDTEIMFSKNEIISKFENLTLFCSAPTFSQAFKFFREKYGLQSYINPELPFNYDEPKYTVIFVKTTKRFTTYKDNTIWVKEGVERRRFSTHEEAELECLVKLIDIVKKQNLKG